MPLLLLVTFAFSTFATASDYYVGDGIACGAREGTVEKVFSGDSLLVRFTYSYYEGVPQNEDSLSVERASRCVRLLGEANGTAPAELTKGDTALCGQKEGTVMAAFTRNVAKVHFYASYEGGQYTPINETHLFDVSRCERQISPGR
jgi:hypothetical protein